MLLFLKNLIFTFVAPGSVAVLGPSLIVREEFTGTAATIAIAVALFGLGGTIYLWCLWDFATFGRGTPAPMDAPKKLVIRGLYHFTRNPMYLGVLTAVLGWTVLFQTVGLVIYAAIIASAFHTFVRYYEEPHLRKEFGAEYLAYTTRVGRWLPKLQLKSKGSSS